MLSLLFLAWAVMFISYYNQEGFAGSRVKNPDAYLLDMQSDGIITLGFIS